MFIESETKQTELFGRLMDRQLFGGEKLSDYITRISWQRAREKVTEINNNLNLNPTDVIKALETKLSTWNVRGDQLDHI